MNYELNMSEIFSKSEASYYQFYKVQKSGCSKFKSDVF